MKLANNAICPETVIKVLLPAGAIPNGATVSKRTGEAEFTLVHSLHVYPYLPKENPDMKQIAIAGYFLIEGRSVSQVSEDTALLWCVTAEDYIECLKDSWNKEEEQ